MTIAVELRRGVFPEISVLVSHETIYQEIYAPDRNALPRNSFRGLHRRRRLRHRQGGRHPAYNHWRSELRSFRERPKAADTRSEVGHYEGDLIVGAGNHSAIITVFDRKSRHLWMESLRHGRSADLALEALTDLFTRIPEQLRRSITWDQGGEIARHRDLTARCGIEVFVTDARAPWQRPTNENGNGLIRRYVGKNTDLNQFTDADLRTIEQRINTMPRRIHHWESAQTIYHRAVAMTD